MAEILVVPGELGLTNKINKILSSIFSKVIIHSTEKEIPDSVKAIVLCNTKMSIDTGDKDVYLIGPEENINPNYTYIKENRIITELLLVLKERYNFYLKEDENYISVSSNILKTLSVVPCPLYLQIGENKFVQFCNVGQTNLHDLVSKYDKKGVTNFFVTINDFYRHQDEIFPSSKVLEGGETIKLSSYKAQLHENILEMGFSKMLLDKYENLKDSLQNNSSEKLKSLLKDFEKNAGSYLYNHSYLTGLISNAVLKDISWATEEHKSDILLGALLHDMGFSDASTAIWQNSSSEAIDKFPAKWRSEILNHSKIILEKIENIDGVNDSVKEVIKYHHYDMDHEENPFKIWDSHLTPLLCVFILSHTMVDEIYKRAFRKEKISDALKVTLEKHNGGKFKPLHKEFESTISKILF